jgi:hypothetical protein
MKGSLLGVSSLVLAGSFAWIAPAQAQFDDPTYTRFLAHYDGNTGSAGRDADYVPGGDPVPTVLRGQTEAAQAKFGPQSLNPVFANNPGMRLQYKTNGVFNNAAGDTFALTAGTVEMWIYRFTGQNVFNSLGLFGTWTGDSDIRIQISGNGNLDASMYNMPGFTDGWGVNSSQGAPGGVGDLIPQGEWSHIAWTWDFSTETSNLWVNGVDVSGAPSFAGSYDQISDYNIPADPTFQIGSIQNGSWALPADSGIGAAMYIDEFRISNIARYTENFTPQGTPFSIPEPSTALGLSAMALLAMKRRRSM